MEQFNVFPHKYSVGTLLGHAVVSNGLDVQNTTNGDLYISQDAGNTWNLLKEGLWYLDTSSTTDFIALSQFNGSTNEILYTRDQGLTWGTTLLPNGNRQLYMEGIFVMSDSVWALTTWIDTNKNQQTSLFFIDYSVNQSDCNVDSDYEDFSPSSFESSCVLGQQITVQRKIPSIQCLADPSITMSTIVNLCNCTRDDYTCSPYYTLEDPTQSDSPCVINTKSSSLTACTPGSNFTVPAYQPVAGTQCVNYLTYLLKNTTVLCYAIPPAPQPLPPPQNVGDNQDNSGVNGGWIAVGVIVGIMVLVLIGILVIHFLKRSKESSDQYEIEM